MNENIKKQDFTQAPLTTGPINPNEKTTSPDKPVISPNPSQQPNPPKK